jgi:hypothetical protein
LKNPTDNFLSAGFINPWEIEHENFFPKPVAAFQPLVKKLAIFESYIKPV